MNYKDVDPSTGIVHTNDLSKLPYISLPKDVLMMASQLLTESEFGAVMKDLINDIYCDCQYEPLRDTKVQDVVFQTMADNIGRLSKGYFTKIRNLKNNK